MAHVSTATAAQADVPFCPQLSHDRLKASTKAWLQAPFVGYQTGFPSTDLYEVRLCPRCRTSLNRPMRIVSMRYVRIPRPAVARPTKALATAAGARR